MNSKEQKLQKWLEFTQKIFSSLEMDPTAKTIVDLGLELMDMDRGFLTLVVSESGGNRFVIGRTSGERTLEEKDFLEAYAFTTECLKTGKIRSKENAKGISLFVPLFPSRTAPDGKNIIGYLYQERLEPASFGPEEMELAEVFALHAGMALENVRLYEMATRDLLTGAYLRHYFDAISLVEWKRTIRHGHSMCILFLDIDNFKSVNEDQGRSAGDSILQKTAGILREACRTEDIISRHGGEEFVALLPETDEAGLRTVAARIQENVSLLLSVPDHKPVTVSIGAACYPRCAVDNVQNLIRLAEIARLRAFQLGGGRTIIYEPGLSNEHTRLL